MKKLNSCLITLVLIVMSLSFVGCSKDNEDYNNINITGIYLSSTNANNNNVYSIKNLLIEVFDFETNKTYTIYKGADLIYKITKPSAFLAEDDYLLPNESSIISIKEDHFKLVVSMVVEYNGNEITLAQSGTINIVENEDSIKLKNKEYPTILASLLNFDFELSNGETERIELIIIANEIDE